MSILSGGTYDGQLIKWWQEGLTFKEICQRLPAEITKPTLEYYCKSQLGLYENRNASPAQRAKEALRYRELKKKHRGP